ncbi:MAG: hypothetical protein A3G41_02775 [Elusimicrobia bacterium RIFCSPLOWO2_12_FULL_59_9]|nr:MAG: hypothetical protein A3G41_02775 [Elusimicrobia bacterium RIFCSPLOWO2_12_FULL_59_9]
MFIAKIVGNVWGTRKHGSLVGARLLLAVPVDPASGRPIGEAVMAVDQRMSAGPGDTVLVMDEGNSARQILDDKKAPVRTVICGIVDAIFYQGKAVKF